MEREEFWYRVAAVVVVLAFVLTLLGILYCPGFAEWLSALDDPQAKRPWRDAVGLLLVVFGTSSLVGAWICESIKSAINLRMDWILRKMDQMESPCWTGRGWLPSRGGGGSAG